MRARIGNSGKNRKELNKRLLAYAAAIPALAAAGPATAEAAPFTQVDDFVLMYGFVNWDKSIAGNGSVTDGTPSTVTLHGSNTNPGCCGSAKNVDLTTVARGDGTVSFSWEWTNSDYLTGFDFGQWLLNGTPVTLSGAFFASGASSFLVSNGDIFGFRVRSDDDCCGGGVLKISKFNAPQVIPEPSTLALMALGLGGLMLARKRRKKA